MQKVQLLQVEGCNLSDIAAVAGGCDGESGARGTLIENRGRNIFSGGTYGGPQHMMHAGRLMRDGKTSHPQDKVPVLSILPTIQPASWATSVPISRQNATEATLRHNPSPTPPTQPAALPDSPALPAPPPQPARPPFPGLPGDAPAEF